MKTCLLFLCIFCHFILSAQSKKASIVVKIIDEAENAIEGATAELLTSKDSSLVKMFLSDRKGLVVIEDISAGKYIVRFTAATFAPAYSGNFTISVKDTTIQWPQISLRKDTIELQAVTVNKKKPFIQKLSDRLVVNVESSILSTGSSALEILERSPGVSVDQNDVISLRGKQGVRIMIDGKFTPLSGADLANYLRGLPSGTIERIDIITNPSAKYDAAGNSGIIDIRMKKDQRLGANASLTAGYGQGVYPKANAGSTFNYRNKKLNVFGNYNYAYRENLNHLILNRNFFEGVKFKGSDDKDNYSKMPVSSHTARIGADYFASKNTTIGFVVSSNFIHFRRKNDNNSLVSDSLYQPNFLFETFATNNDHNDNTVANINFRHNFDSSGREITADIDYGFYNTASLSSTATKYFNLDGSKRDNDYILDGIQDGRLEFITAKADYSHTLNKTTKLEAGIKTTYVSSDNDVQFFDMSSGSPVDDVTKTNHFLYKEYDHAGYVNIDKQFSRFDIKMGLRGEQTNVDTRQVKGDIHFDTSYFQVFPSAFINYKLKEDQTVGVSVSRRIRRPAYSDLNPFLFLIDVTTYGTGNPGLLPELTWSYELNYTVKEINVSFGYSHTKNNINIAIARFRDVFPDIASEDNVTVQIPVNLTSSDYYGLSVAAPFRIAPWWDIVNNLDIYYNHFNGSLGITRLNSGSPTVDIRTNNSFIFKKGWTAELNGSFSSGGRYGFMVSKPQWGLSAGFQKNLMRNRATIRVNVTDIFWTNLPRAKITYDNYLENWRAYRETRVANINFTYRLGNNKVAAARRRATASEEERRRAGIQ